MHHANQAVLGVSIAPSTEESPSYSHFLKKNWHMLHGATNQLSKCRAQKQREVQFLHFWAHPYTKS